ncbi:TadE/TadG family type IV pilus assembly protein [Novosphingobium sp. FKTRR1]|uniref:TadE/TadG family type IV pilus assembly protein n=1 Tax=Novosphingobium sp. FKTRR1 TaxID=2879118 RepID=UPI001CF08065|nr:TadE/TadG family type IV pilus assembly protein [Novosphingobium sp. FKTRR1]
MSRLARETCGASAIEFALAAPVVLGLLIATLEIALLYLAQQGLETAAESCGRYILTGQAQTSFTGIRDANGNLTTTPQQQFKAYACTQLPTMLGCGNLYVDVTHVSNFGAVTLAAPTLVYDKNNNVISTLNYDPGAQGSIVVVRLLYNWPVISVFGFDIANQPGSHHLLVATSVAKTEGYS